MSLKILIVEDDRHTRRILETLFLRDPGFSQLDPHVFLASDGNEGLRLMRAERPEVIITDLMMPNMDGFQFCRAVRGDPMSAGSVLIVMSAIYKDTGVISALKAELGAEFFAKPFQVSELLRTVRRRVDAKREAQDTPDATSPRPGNGQQAAAPATAHVERLPLSPAATPSPAAVQAAAPAPSPARVPERPISLPSRQRGELSDRALPCLLLDCHEAQATGTLTIRRGNAKKDIYLLVGHPIGAASTIRSETLGVYLVARRVITEAQHRAAVDLAQSKNIKLGRALVESGLLTEAEVLEHLQAQVRHKIVASLRWRDGEYQFSYGDTFSERMTKCTLDPARVVFEGLRRTARVDEIALRFSGRERLSATPRTNRYADAWRRAFGNTLVGELPQNPTIERVLALLPQVQGLPQIDALLLCEMAQLETASAGASRPELSTASKTPDPFRLTDLEQAAVDSLAPPVAPSEEAEIGGLLDALFGGEESKVGPLPEGALAGRAEPAAPSGDLDLPESGVIGLEAPSAAPVPSDEIGAAVGADPSARALEVRAEISRVYLSLHDTDHYELLGVSREATFEQIVQAFSARTQQYKLEHFAAYDLGRDYGKVEELNLALRKAFETLSDPLKRMEYDRAQGQARPSPENPFEAELLYQQAKERLAAGDASYAVTLLEQATTRTGAHAEYYALLGWARLLAEGDAARTRAAADISRALAMEPDLPAGHEYAARLALRNGDPERAENHLSRALDADPHRRSALELYEQLCTERGDFRRIERQYRKLIHRLGDRDRQLTAQLWHRLGDCYRDHLNNIESARVAYEVAAKLSPNEAALADALVSVTASDASRWRETARALRAKWRMHPEDPHPGRALHRLHAQGGRHDAALVAAQALIARAQAEPEALELYRQHRPRFLARLTPPLPEATFERLLHPEDDRAIGELFAIMAPVSSALHPLTLEHLGISEENRIAEPPEGFAKILRYVCDLLAVPVPTLYEREDFGNEVHIAGTEPVAMLVGPRALAEEDRVTLGARLARAATYLLPGRATGGALPTRALKTFLLAGMTLAQYDLVIEDPDGAIGRMREALASTDGAVQERIKSLVGRITRQKSSVNLSRWVRALARTADRMGLLIGNDLVVAARIATASGAQGADIELVDFALSEEYLDLREALGLTLAV